MVRTVLPPSWARSAWALGACLLLSTLAAPPASAQSPAIPPALAPWVPWVLDAHPELECARLNNGFTCGWPGELTLDAQQTQGSFTLSVWLDRPQLVALPGGDKHWPQQVEVDGQSALVVQQGAGAAVKLGRGQHTVTGRLLWKAPPEVVQLPADIGVVRLSFLGKAVDRPRMDETGRLWVKEGAGPDAAGEADNQRVAIYRKVIDGVPIKIVTMLELNISGRSRELTLGKVLVPQSQPMDLRGALPVQISADGEVKVYARPGTHRVEIDAVISQPVTELAAPKLTQTFFDSQEVWVWQPDEAIRSVELSGLNTVDPGRTSLPQDWRGQTTLLAEGGQALKLTVTRRGEAQQSPNQVTLNRVMWLDLDGSGYTIRDELQGTLNQGWRLNYGDAGVLGRVSRGADELLITADVETKQQGVELREAGLGLTAESRLESSTVELPIVGWAHDVQSLQVDLHLPPGWSVLGARGVDSMTNTWIDTWTLFEFFILLLIAGAMGRLFGWPWGLIAALAMIFSHGQPDAPRYVWFSLVASLALLRVLPERLWVRWIVLGYLVVSFLSFVAVFAPFAHSQVRYALNPQVQPTWTLGSQSSSHTNGYVVEQSTLEMPRGGSEYEGADGIVSDLAMRKADVKPMDKLGYKSGKSSYQQELRQVDPNEVVQTGPGLPSWSWQSWQLRWQGPVFKDHTVRLWLLSPGLMFLVRITCVLLFLLMALVVVAPSRLSMREGDKLFDLWRTFRRAITPALLAASALLAAHIAAPTAVHAQDFAQQAQQAPNGFNPSPTIDEPMLRELERRLLAARQCEGPCVSASRLDVSLRGQSVELRAEVHAQQAAGWSLPGPASLLRISAVSVDGVPTRQLRREASGLVAVRIPAGRHIVVVRAELPRQDVITIQLDPEARPQHVSVDAPDWSVDGLDDAGRPENSLQLSRRAPAAPDAAKPDEGEEAGRELPPWYAVERLLVLGMPWQTTTTVRRARADRPQLIKVPLLARESVITDGVRVEDGHALVQLARGVTEFSYTSELAITETIKFVAPNSGAAAGRMTPSEARRQPEGELRSQSKDKPWTESWVLECSRIWRCGFEGLTPTRTVSDAQTLQPTWHPWPGEALTLTIRKPQGVPGSASTLTRVDYEITPGERLLAATLKIDARASQGSWKKITLPEGAQLQEVKIDGQARTLRLEGRVLDVPLKLGKQQVELRWQQSWERGARERFPAVDLGGEAVNLHMSMQLGDRRWLLGTSGPDWGPAVLFWSHLALLVVLALLLGRLKRLPLTTPDWLLLAIGMSQLPILAMVPPLVWFGAMVWRRERPADRWYLFNLGQLGLIALTGVLLVTLYAAVHTNLLVDINMQVRGADSTNQLLRWYVDRVSGQTPDAGVTTLPILVWRVAMLCWALWMVVKLLRWLPWGWRCFSDAGLWRSSPPPAPYAPKGPNPPPSGGSSPPPASGGPSSSPGPAAPAASAPPSADGAVGATRSSGAQQAAQVAAAASGEAEASGADKEAHAPTGNTREVPTDSVAAILTQAADPEEDGATRTYTRPDHLAPLADEVAQEAALEAGAVPASVTEPPTQGTRVPVATMAFARPAASTPDAEQLAPNPPAALSPEQRATDELPAVDDASTGLYAHPASEASAGEDKPAAPPQADDAPSKRTAMFTMPHIVAEGQDDEDEDDDDDDDDGALGGGPSRTTVFAIPGNSVAEEDAPGADAPSAPVDEEQSMGAERTALQWSEPPAADESPSRMTAQLTSLKQLQRDEDLPPAADDTPSRIIARQGILRRAGRAATPSEELKPADSAPSGSYKTLTFNATKIFSQQEAEQDDGPLAEEPHERTAMLTSPSQAFTQEDADEKPARVEIPGIKPIQKKGDGEA